MVRWCWVNFQYRGVLLIWIRVGQGPTALAVGAGGGWLDIFTLVYHFSFLSPFLWETSRYRLKYCLKGPLSPKQPTNQPTTPPPLPPPLPNNHHHHFYLLMPASQKIGLSVCITRQSRHIGLHIRSKKLELDCMQK